MDNGIYCIKEFDFSVASAIIDQKCTRRFSFMRFDIKWIKCVSLHQLALRATVVNAREKSQAFSD